MYKRQVQNSDVYRILLQIQKIDKQVQLLCKELPRAALRQFAQKCLVDEIVLTNDIEGVNSTRPVSYTHLDVYKRQEQVHLSLVEPINLES